MDARTLGLAVLLLVAGIAIGIMVGRLWAKAGMVDISTQLARAQAERQAAFDRLEQFRGDRQAMAQQFEHLSITAEKRQVASAEHSAQQRLNETKLLLEPLHNSLQAMNNRLMQVEKDRAQGAADLARQVDSVRLSNEALRHETQALVTALRRPQVRGAWGETQLKRAAEIAGMVERCDFDTQVVYDADQGGYRPDMRVNMADGKVLFVDAKTPLGNFIDAFATEEMDQRNALLDSYVANLVTHINQLSSKNYWRLDAGSPEMVVLFVPSDALLQVALDRRSDLHEYAAAHSIFLASPSILIPLLRAVQHGWKQTAFVESARDVAMLGRDLYERLATMGSHLDKLGRGLTGAVNAYNDTVGSLERRVLVSARKLHDLEIAEGDLPGPRAVEATPRVMTAPELLGDVSDHDASDHRDNGRRDRSAGDAD